MEKVGAYTDRTTEGGEWRPGNPASGQQATPMLAPYFNMLQRELVTVVESAGFGLDKGNDGQLLQAIRRLRGGAGTGFGVWNWSTGTAGAPGAGQVRLNNANPELATQVLLAEISIEVIDYSMLIGAAQAGDTIYLQPRAGAALGYRFRVTGAPVDNGSYRTIPVSYIAGSGGLPPADTAMLVHLAQTTAADASTDGIAGSFSNLKASATGANATVTVTADAVCVKNAAGQQKVLNGVALAINSAQLGVNGRDTGLLNASSWYSVWVIYNPTSLAVSGLLSLSATAPILPAGYTHKARIGWIRTDGTASKYPLSFVQNGRVVQYALRAASNVVEYPVMASGVAGNPLTPTYVAVAVSGFCPPTAGAIKILLGSTGVNQIAQAAPNPVGGVRGTSPVYFNVGSNGDWYYPAEFVLESASIFYAANGTGGYVRAMGWEDNL